MKFPFRLFNLSFSPSSNINSDPQGIQIDHSQTDSLERWVFRLGFEYREAQLWWNNQGVSGGHMTNAPSYSPPPPPPQQQQQQQFQMHSCVQTSCALRYASTCYLSCCQLQLTEATNMCWDGTWELSEVRKLDSTYPQLNLVHLLSNALANR